jgi:HK97 family phage major capsid protein
MITELNKRKKEILAAQDKMLMNAVETKTQLSAADETSFANMTTELDAINTNIARFEAIEKGNREVGNPREQVVLHNASTATKYFAFGGAKNRTPLPNCTAEYVKGFWASLKSPADHQKFLIQNASLGEGGTAAAGGALVPIETDPSIVPLAIEETIARSLSRVITTEMNLQLPFQSALTAAAIKPESNSTGTNSFASNAPSFATTTLGAFMVGDSVTASWELLQDSKAANTFIPMDIQRGIVTAEEALFIGTGTGNSLTGTNQPQGYLGNGTTAFGQSITAGAAAIGIDPVIDTMGSLLKAYYNRAKWLVNRQEFNRLLKAQIAANQYQTFIVFDPSGMARLFGYEVGFSGNMPVLSASPATNGAWLFGDFTTFATIGDRFDSNIRIQVNPYVFQAQGQTLILGYRRTDQRILVGQAVVELQTNG